GVSMVNRFQCPSLTILRLQLAAESAYSNCCETLERRQVLSISRINVPDWLAQGPGPVTDGGTSVTGGNVLGPTAATSLKVGSASAIAVDPANPKHLFAATTNGGVWETNDFTAA